MGYAILILLQNYVTPHPSQQYNPPPPPPFHTTKIKISDLPPQQRPFLNFNAITSASLNSFNCSSGNATSNVNCTIQNDVDSFSGKDKYKNDVSIFFSLHFLNELSNGEKEKAMKKVLCT